MPDGKLPWLNIPGFNHFQGHLSGLYAPHYVRSSQRFPDARRVTAEDLEALEMFDHLAEDPELRMDMEFRPGDMQFVMAGSSPAMTGIVGYLVQVQQSRLRT